MSSIPMYPASLTEARNANSKYYFTGIPCKNGHTSLRKTSDQHCVECDKIRAKINKDKGVRVKFSDSELLALCVSKYKYENGYLYCNSSGRQVGSISKEGYWKTNVRHNNRQSNQFIHRLIFLMHYGFLPKVIDRINGDKLDNRIENLREATQQQNTFNRKVRANTKSGVKGVSYVGNSTSSKPWAAGISYNGKYTVLGHFDTIEEAAACYQAAALKLHGEFARFD